MVRRAEKSALTFTDVSFGLADVGTDMVRRAEKSAPTFTDVGFGVADVGTDMVRRAEMSATATLLNALKCFWNTLEHVG